MRILLVNDYKSEVGGAEIYVNNLANALSAHGHDVKIFASEDLVSNKFIDWKNNHFPQLNAITFYIHQIFNIRACFALKKLIEEFNPDIVHLNNIYKRMSPLIFIPLKNIPVVMTIHGYEHFRYDTYLQSPKDDPSNKYKGILKLAAIYYNYLNKKMFFWSFSRVKLFIAPSKFIQRIALHNNMKPCVQIYNGTNLFPYTPVNNYNNLLFVGRLEKEKGVEIIIHALRSVVNACPYVHLNIIGTGSQKKHLISLVEQKKIDTFVTFSGKQEYSTIISYYQNATVVLIPSSDIENLPTVAIEAMSIGRPVIGTNTGGLPELIDDNSTGYIVAEGDSKQLADKIITLLNNPNTVNIFGKNARKKAQEKFNIQSHVEKIESIYKEIITTNQSV